MDDLVVRLPSGDLQQAAPNFFSVAQMIPTDQEIVTVPPDTSIEAALSMMRLMDFSQLPIVSGSQVVGVFSYKSFGQHVHTIAEQPGFLQEPVVDYATDLSFARPRDDIHSLLPALEQDDAVLVGAEDRLIALITTSDVTRFLWEATAPFVLVRDIELAVRRLMQVSCPAPEAFATCIASSLTFRKGRAVPTTPDELSLGELVRVLGHEENFDMFFNSAFGRNAAFVISRLEPVREIRNKMFHFVEPLDPGDRQTLVSVRRWMQRKSTVFTVAA